MSTKYAVFNKNQYYLKIVLFILFKTKFIFILKKFINTIFFFNSSQKTYVSRFKLFYVKEKIKKIKIKNKIIETKRRQKNMI